MSSVGESPSNVTVPFAWSFPGLSLSAMSADAMLSTRFAKFPLASTVRSLLSSSGMPTLPAMPIRSGLACTSSETLRSENGGFCRNAIERERRGIDVAGDIPAFVWSREQRRRSRLLRLQQLSCDLEPVEIAVGRAVERQHDAVVHPQMSVRFRGHADRASGAQRQVAARIELVPADLTSDAPFTDAQRSRRHRPRCPVRGSLRPRCRSCARSAHVVSTMLSAATRRNGGRKRGGRVLGGMSASRKVTTASRAVTDDACSVCNSNPRSWVSMTMS